MFKKFILLLLFIGITQICYSADTYDRQERANIIAPADALGNVAITDLTQYSNMIKGYSSAVTGTITLTPTTGYKIRVIAIIAKTASTSGDISVSFNSSPTITNAIFYVPSDIRGDGHIVNQVGSIDGSLYVSVPANTWMEIFYREE